jgi:hypothetical protein
MGNHYVISSENDKPLGERELPPFTALIGLPVAGLSGGAETRRSRT